MNGLLRRREGPVLDAGMCVTELQSCRCDLTDHLTCSRSCLCFNITCRRSYPTCECVFAKYTWIHVGSWSSSSPFPRGTFPIPLSKFNHTHVAPRPSTSYHQFNATVISSDCRTWCHHPAGKYNVSPSCREMVIGCAEAGRAPGCSGCVIDDQRTMGVEEGEGVRIRGEPSEGRM